MADATNDDTTLPAPEPQRKTPKPPKDRHPLLIGTPVGVWCEAAAGKMRGYPLTRAGFEARCATLRENSEGARRAGKLNRLGVPTGWAGRRAEVAELRESVRPAAARATKTLLKADDTDPRVIEVLKEAAAMALSPTYTRPIRLAAMRVFFEFILPRPVIRSAVKGGDGLAFLSALVEAVPEPGA